MQSIVGNFPWQRPPWQGGTTKYRLGMRPISLEHWFQGQPSPDLRVHKYNLLKRAYGQVVQALPEARDAQARLAEQMQAHEWYKAHSRDATDYPDLIAALSLQVSDDLCVIQTGGEQRLIAASVCSPSYWNIKEKIGLSLSAVHRPVTSLQRKIGSQIQRFITQAPVMTPFERSNWFVHGNRERMHLAPEGEIAGSPENWFLRSERETLCRFHDDYLLFTINVRFAPLRDIVHYPLALEDLTASLSRFDSEEIDYFGGGPKYQRLGEYLAGLQ
jgi:hypothetical protein